jgi:hypothetical protein
MEKIVMMCCAATPGQATGKTIWSPAIPNLNESLLAKNRDYVQNSSMSAIACLRQLTVEFSPWTSDRGF